MIDCSPWPSSYIFQDLLAMRSLKLFKTLNTLKMTAAPVFETSVTLNNNSPILDYVHLDDQTQLTFEMTPRFKPFTVLNTLPRFALWVFLTPLSVFDLLAAWCMVHDLGVTKHSSIHTDNLQLDNHGSLDISFVRTISGSNEKTIFSEPGCLKHQSYKEMFEFKVKLPEIFENHLIFWRWLSKSHRVFFADCLYNIVSLILTASLGR